LDAAEMSKAKGPGLLLIGVGSLLTSMIAAGFLLGYGVDVLFDTQPVFFLSFGLLGFIGGILKAYKILSDPELH
jgi:ATP synthase protein I